MAGGESRGSNSHWAQLIVEELTRTGCRYFVISPGSRSTPLVIAAARHPGATARVCLEERGAGFHAVGYARATGTPAVLICTSGTAVANYLPAVVEAAMSELPLLLVTADRPPELHDSGANQTILQRGIFGAYTRWSAELPVPTARIDARVVLTTIDQAVFRAAGPPAGPVHLNCLIAEPLEPEPVPPALVPGKLGDRWSAKGEPFTTYHGTGSAAVAAGQDALRSLLAECQRGLVVAGSLPRAAAAAIQALAAHLHWPLLGDATSGVSGTPGLQLLLQSAPGRALLSPDVVLQFGSPVVSKAYLALLAETAPQLVQVAAGPRRLDPTHSATLRLVASPASVARHLVAQLPARSATDHGAAVVAAGQRACAAVDTWAFDQRQLLEPVVAHIVAAAAAGPPVCGLFVASSMPIRDLDTFATPLAPEVVLAANRGASGIDGSVASAVGLAAGLERPVIALLGDLALLHDLPSLSQLPQIAQGIVFVVINNRGGGIFSLLPLARVEAPGFPDLFERYFGTPHDVSFAEVAAAFGITYRRPRTPLELEDALATAAPRAQNGTSTLLEVSTERAANAAVRAALRQLVDAAIAAT